MKKIVLILILALLYSACPVFAAEEFSFRGVTWDMSIDDIKAVETGVLKAGGSQLLIYEIEDFYQTQATVYYYFKNNHLHKINLSVNKYEEMDLLILPDKYMEIKNDFQNRYGNIVDEYTNNTYDSGQQYEKLKLHIITVFEGELPSPNTFTAILALYQGFEKPYRISLVIQII